MITERTKNRFWKKVDKNGPIHPVYGPCWVWTRCHNSNGGYIQFYFEHKRMYVHRLSWLIHKDYIPDGLQVCHKCDNPRCVNPEHLFLGTNQDNINDRVSKGRSIKGSKVAISKLVEEEILEIRRLYATKRYTQDELSKMFSVTQGHISAIVCRREWSHI